MKTLLKKYQFEIGLTLVYLVLILVFTFPLILNLSTALFGYTSDNFSASWYLWWLKYAYDHGLDPNFTTMVGAPFGTTYGVLALEELWIGPAKILTFLTNEVVALNLLLLFSFPLAGISTYFLARYLKISRAAAGVAGLIFAFAPYHFWQGYSHVSLALSYVLPLFFLSVLYFHDKNNLFSALLLALAFLTTFLTSFYYGLFSCLLLVLFFLFQVVYNGLQKKWYFDKKRLKVSLFAALVIAVVLSPTLLKFYLANNQEASDLTGVPKRTINDFLSLSIRPWDLFLPAPDHPLLGGLSKNVYKSITHLGSDYKVISAFLPERVLYLGLIPSLLALFGFYLAIKKKQPRYRAFLLAFLIVAIFLFALPPFLAVRGTNYYLPSYLIFEFLPQLRVLARLGVLILLFVSLLASLGLDSLLVNYSPKRMILISLTLGLILFEYLPFPPAKITTFKPIPGYYQWAKNLDKEVIIAEYPPRFDVADALVWQRYHQKKLFNMFNNEYYRLWEYIDNLSSESSSEILSSLGVKYVIFHTDYLYSTPHPFDELYYTRFAKPPTVFKDKGVEIDKREFSWLKLVGEYPGARVYEIPDAKTKFLSFNPNNAEPMDYVYGHSWQTKGELRNLYFFNFDKAVVQGILTYDLKINNGTLTEVGVNGVMTTDLRGKVFKLLPGRNIITFITDNDQAELNFTNIKFEALKTTF